ncbi:hypothetical protein SUGI_0665660 [Cryptomeria japonica]|nr:hypothetical protein SUGI_0665660 [Cryptomeria japonica]
MPGVYMLSSTGYLTLSDLQGKAIWSSNNTQQTQASTASILDTAEALFGFNHNQYAVCMVYVGLMEAASSKKTFSHAAVSKASTQETLLHGLLRSGGQAVVFGVLH